MIELAMHRTGDQQVTQFVERHQRALLRWLTALGADGTSADDHCQEALLAALHEGAADWPVARARAWLRTAAKNLFLMQLRQQRRRPTHRLDDVEQAWLAVSADDDGGDGALERLRSCLERADARDRDLLDRRYREQQGRDRMARELGIGEAGVKQALRRARARLRVCIEHREREERT